MANGNELELWAPYVLPVGRNFYNQQPFSTVIHPLIERYQLERFSFEQIIPFPRRSGPISTAIQSDWPQERIALAHFTDELCESLAKYPMLLGDEGYVRIHFEPSVYSVSGAWKKQLGRETLPDEDEDEDEICPAGSESAPQVIGTEETEENNLLINAVETYASWIARQQRHLRILPRENGPVLDSRAITTLLVSHTGEAAVLLVTRRWVIADATVMAEAIKQSADALRKNTLPGRFTGGIYRDRDVRF